MGEGGIAAEERVWRALPDGTRAALESGMPATDLQTLLLSVARARAAAVTPATLLRRWSEDRFVRPSTHDPRRVVAAQARLWELLPQHVTGVELSPVAPIGTITALAPLQQHRVVTTTRSSEVVSDPTNALAVEAALRRRGRKNGRVDLAAYHRVVRAQRFGPGYAAHFALFALVSSTRAGASGTAEASLLIDHLRYWQRVLAAFLPHLPVRIEVTVFHDRTLSERLADTVMPAIADGPVPVMENPVRTQGIGYYRGAALKLWAYVDGTPVDLGDGGLTDWTARLLGDAKERCLTSCIAPERLSELASDIL
jgi:hypothetical protein